MTSRNLLLAALAAASLALSAGLAPALHRVRIVAAPRLTRALVAQPPRVHAPRMQGFEFDFAQDEDEDDEDEAMAIAGDNPVLKIDANASVAELKEQLKTFGLRTTGSRPQLLERLEQIQRKIKKGLPVSEQEVLPSNELRWYMVQTANGFERAVERTIGQVIDAQNMQDDIEKVFVPVTEGESSVRDASVMPSYIFVKMRMDKDLHQLVTSFQYVVNFVGNDRGGTSFSGQPDGTRGFVRPMPLTQAAFEEIVACTKRVPSSVEGGADPAAPAAPRFEVDQMVQVNGGSFKGLQGPVLTTSDEEESVTLLLRVMGRDTPVELPMKLLAPLVDLEGL